MKKVFLWLWLCPAAAGALVVPAYDSSRPLPDPGLPAGFDVFDPPTAPIRTVPGSPEFAEWSRTAGPDDTILLTGEGLGRFLAFGQTDRDNGTLSVPTVRRRGTFKSAVTLGAALPRDSMYLCWSANARGWSRPVAINRTEAWWLGPDEAASGASTSLFGRNLSLGKVKPAVYVARHGQRGFWARLESSNPYKLVFTLPQGLRPGTYEVWAHNGHGGKLGWDGPLALRVRSDSRWDGPVYNVRKYGAVGDGISDDQAAFEVALEKSRRHPGSTVYVPTGTYAVSQGFRLASHSRWLGQGLRSVIRLHPRFGGADSERSTALFYTTGKTSQAEINSLALEAAGALQGPRARATNHTLCYLRSVDGLVLEGLRIRAQGCQGLDLSSGGRHALLKDCSIVSSGNFLGDASQVRVEGCHFFGTDDANSLLASWGGRQIDIERCTGQDLDGRSARGWSAGRFLVINGVFGGGREIYVGDCETRRLGVRPGDENQNSGEQVLWEGHGTVFSGRMRAGKKQARGADQKEPHAEVVFLPGLEHPERLSDGSYTCAIVGGRGLGQHRRITSSRPDGSLLLASPWTVAPDAASQLVVGAYFEKAVLYQNRLQGKREPRETASCGIQAYSGVFDLVADGNTLSDLRAGLNNWAIMDKPAGFQPCYFHLYQNNRILDCLHASGTRFSNFTSLSPGTGACILGATYRRNVLEGLIQDGFSVDSGQSRIEDTIVEHNRGAGLSEKAALPRGTSSIVYKNKFAAPRTLPE